jgi:hypothetical protein
VGHHAPVTTSGQGAGEALPRLGRFIKRRPWAAYLALTGLAHPITEILLFGERALQTAHDVFDDDIPRLFSIPADWRDHGPSLWDPHLTAGNALLAQFALPPLAPDVLLSFVLPPFVAYSINFALMVFLAGLAMHLFLRDSLRLPAVACFAGGIMSIFAVWGYILGYAVLLFPLALLWTERAVARDRRPRDVVALALLVAFLVFSSQIQLVVLGGVLVLAWIVATSEQLRGAGPTRRALRIRAAGAHVGRMVAIWLIGALLAAPVLLTQLVALPESHRELWQFDAVGNVLADWLGRLAGIAFGVEVAGFGGELPLYGTWFPGAIALPVLLLSLVIPRERRRERAALWLLVGVLVADLVATATIPLQDGVPLLSSFQVIRVRHLVPPLLVINVAIGVAWLVRTEIRQAIDALGRRRALLLSGVLALAGVALALQALVIARPILRWLRREASLADIGPERLAWLLAAVGFGAAAAAVLATLTHALRGPRRRPFARRALGGGLLAIVLLCLVAERASFARSSLLSHRGMGTWAEEVSPTEAHAFIAGQAGEGRVLSVIEHANRSLSAGLDAADGYQTIYPARYHALFGALIRPQLDTSPGLAEYFDTWGSRAYAFSPRIRKPIADLLGIRWLYVAPDSAIDPRLRRRYANQAPVDPSFVPRFTGPSAHAAAVYENPDAFPRTFVVHEAVVHPDRAAAVAALGAATSAELRGRAHLVSSEVEGVDLASVTSALPPPSAAPAPVPTVSAGAVDTRDQTTLVLDTPDRVHVATATAQPGILVLADTYAHGWVAEIDGQPTDLFPVDVALRGVALPAGEHVVTFRYQPIETYAGFAVSLVTALALVTWLIVSWRARRRPLAPTPVGGRESDADARVGRVP